jgi:hypothetical protein
MKENMLEFSVEGIGTFKVLKEPLARTLFFDRRAELAKLLGGRTELVRIESTVQQYAGSTDPLEKRIADGLAFELFRANAFLDLKNSLVESPRGFNIDTLKTEEFDAIWNALEVARGSFRKEDGRETEGTVGATPAQG